MLGLPSHLHAEGILVGEQRSSFDSARDNQHLQPQLRSEPSGLGDIFALYNTGADITLVLRGYSRVQGLNEAGDAQLRNLGATPVRGELTSLDGLRQQSAEAGWRLEIFPYL
jgi:hypothetical protein